jgi:Protein of unknown function (DUF4079)
MLVALGVASAALRSGLRLRTARRRHRPPPPGERPRHLRLAKTAVVLVWTGFGLGALSAAFLRGFDPFASAHGWLALSAALLFVATALTGRTLERGGQRLRDVHAVLALSSVALAAAALGTGFVLLP